jgi:transposase-like protein
MITQVLHCLHYHGTDIVRHGKALQGKQRYRCRETACQGHTFLLDSSYPGQSQHIKEQIVEMAMNASGIRDTARLACQSHDCHQGTQKKAPALHQVNQALLASMPPEQVEVEICRVDELEGRHGLSSELDEMWSYVVRRISSVEERGE